MSIADELGPEDSKSGCPSADLESVEGLFDSKYYLLNNLDVAETEAQPLTHFLNFGWQEGRWPNPYFDPAWYLASNHDVRDIGQNPLLHYARYGELEGRRPISFFDPAWYRERHRLGPY